MSRFPLPWYTGFNYNDDLMSIKGPICLFLLLLLTAREVAAQASGDTDANRSVWFSYRDLYQSMVRFEKYGKPKQFIQNQLEIIPKDKTVTLDGLRLTLTGKSMHLNLPVDAVGRAVFPLLKAAYDENAELQVNRPANSIGMEPVTSIVTRADGIYESADLRSACDQALQYLRYVSNQSYRGKQCAGVKFAYPRDATDVIVKLRTPDRGDSRLTIAEGAAFESDATSKFKIVIYRFSEWPDKGQIITNNTPLAIAALFE